MVSLKALTSSIPRLLAASSSITSILFPPAIDLHWLHLLQGSVSFFPCFSQLTIFAMILAADVFPVPLGPANKSAWGIFPEETIFFNSPLTESKSKSSRV